MSTQDQTPAPTGLPIVAVAAHPFYVRAKDTNAQGAQNCTLFSFYEAFSNPYRTDAHFLPYTLLNTGLEAFPMLAKAALGKLRAVGCEALATMLVLDYDNPGHLPWKKDEWGQFLNRLQDDPNPLAWNWTILYGTKKGARLVYVLDTPITVEHYESKQLWLSNELGAGFDKNVWDWTRCFRLPYVTRADAPMHRTWEEDYSDMLGQYNNRLATAELGDAKPVSKTTSYATIKTLTNEQPTPEEVQDYMTATGNGRQIQTEFYKEAKRRLRGRDCFPCIFENKAIAEEGARSSTLMRLVGQAVALLYFMPAVTPEKVYALFYSAAIDLEPAQDTPDWTVFLWAQVLRCFERETAKIEGELLEKEAKRQEAFNALDLIIDGMRKWSRAPELFSERVEETYAWAMRHLIISTGQNYMVINPDGWYDPMQVRSSQLVPRLYALKMEALIPTKKQAQNGALQSVHVQDIINEHCTIVANIRGIPEIRKAYIENIDSPTAQVVIPTYRRTTQLPAEYDEYVDIWLRKLFGQNYELVCKWIAWSLAWDEGPICALSVCGKSGSGKKMFVGGLKECLSLPRISTSRDMRGDFQYGLFQSPFLSVNEGWPNGTMGQQPSDLFRALVSGDEMKVMKKFQDPIDLQSPVRVILTGNNMDIVKMLALNKDLSPDDREALSIRLLHVSITNEAAEWLKLNGGVALTGRPGRRWIGGDGGAESDYVVAKHFLYLYENRHAYGACGSRFLVEGNNAQPIMTDMRISSGSAPLVIETLIRLIENPGRVRGITVEAGELFVLQDAILTFFRDEIAMSAGLKLTSNMVANVLNGLVKEAPMCVTKQSRPDVGAKYWQNVDAALLLEVAKKQGMSSDRLEKIVEEQGLRSTRGVVLFPVQINAAVPPVLLSKVLRFDEINKGTA